MNDTVNVGVLLEYTVELFLICDVDLIVLWLFAADQLYSVQSLWRRVVEVVNYDDVVAGFEESQGCERANVAGTTGLESTDCFQTGQNMY
jgi:hypothetical protein